jgi:hypothetical protein
VIAVSGARRVDGHVEAAVLTSERVRHPAPGTRALIARQGDLR